MKIFLKRCLVLFLLCAACAVSAGDPDDSARDERARRYFGDDVLHDQDGKPLRFYSDLIKGNVVLIHVLYTGCKDACPLQTKRLIEVRRLLSGADIHFVSLSLDPQRDDAAALKAFARKHKVDESAWRFLSGDKATVSGVLKRVGLWTDDLENHSMLLLAGNARTAHWIKIRPDLPESRIAADLQRLREEG